MTDIAIICAARDNGAGWGYQMEIKPMKFATCSAAALGMAVFAVVACCRLPMAEPPSLQAIPGFVTELSAFEQFIATGPTPAQFRARYPDVTLALPGSINTKELRLNNSRYFAQLNVQGRISGGQFQ